MNTTNTFDIISKWLAITGLLAIIIFLGFGWLKGMYWERELRVKRKHR